MSGKLADPHPISCPACGRRSQQGVQVLLNLQALCPHCGHSLADIGARLQQVLATNRAQAMLLAILIKIEERDPRIKFTDDCIGALPGDPFGEGEHSPFCLRDLATATQARLAHVPAAERPIFALQAVEAAFRQELPNIEYPSLDIPLIPFLKDALSSRRRES
jgi:hypothetical protein